MKKKAIILTFLIMTAVLLCGFPCAASSVSSAIEGTWKEAQGHIKTVVDNVVFPVIDVVLAVFFFVKLAVAYFDCAPVKAL